MKLAAVLLITAAIYILNVQGAGFENFLCRKDPNAKLFFPCDIDCQHQHGALTGECVDVNRGDFNCKCKGRSKIAYEASLQCSEQSDEYREICNVDCMCHHAAKGGFCDWKMKACICVGENKNNVNCPHKTIPDYAMFIYEKAGEKGLGEHGMKFVGPLIKNKQNQQARP